MADWEFKNPPVWEAGIAALTQSPTMLDDYDVAAIHGLFSAEFPRAERQMPVAPMQPFQLGGEQNFAPTIQLQVTPATTRWWFTSENSRNLIQLQDQFIGRNWRKLGPGSAIDQDYPTFDVLLSSFSNTIERLSGNSTSRGRQFPDPSICDIIYINMIPLVGKDGDVLRIRDILPMIQFNEPIFKTGIQMQWFESFGEPSAALALHVSIQVVAIPDFALENAPSPAPFVRLSMNARAPCRSWSEHTDLSVKSHAYMRERLLALTTETAQATWRAL